MVAAPAASALTVRFERAVSPWRRCIDGATMVLSVGAVHRPSPTGPGPGPQEARLLNHDFIGTDHVLLGLIREDEGITAQALRSLGIRLEAVRTKVQETVAVASKAPSGSPPWSPRAKRVLELSLREAQQLGHKHIGTEHLLLGLVR